jgi:hypothetical protein
MVLVMMVVAQHGSKPHFKWLIASIARDINLVNALTAATIAEARREL